MTRTPVPKYEVIEKFLKKVTTEKSTRSVYRSWINHYFKLLDVKNPDIYFDNGRDYTSDIEKVIYAIENYPPRSQQSIVSCVKRFMLKNNVKIPDDKWEEWTTRNHIDKPYAITDDKRFSPEELRTVFEHANLKMKALALFLSSSGCRLNEALLMTSDWLDMKNRMVKIPAEVSKTKRKRYTFFSEESKRVLEEWLKQRDKFLTHSVNKSKYKREQLTKKGIKDAKELIKKEDRIFPFEKDNAIKSWNLLLEKAGSPYNKKDTNAKLRYPRYKYHIHTLRKFWFSRMMSTDANVNHINFLGGHETYLAGVYNQFLDQSELLKKTYDKFSLCLNIYDVEPRDIDEIRASVEKKDKEITKMKSELVEMRLTMLELKEKINIKF